MTDRLTVLLHDEATALDVPAPPAATVLARGRGLRRRHHLTTILASTAVLAVLAGGAVGATRLIGDPEPVRDLPLASADALRGWAAASGSTVLLGNGSTATVDGTVKSVYYTSVGVLARTGESATTDAPDSSYWLVTEDGSVTDFSLELGDRVPGTDPTLPYLAYAEPTADPRQWRVVLRDVTTGAMAHEIIVDGAFTWGGWVAPPVSLSGDHVYVGMDDATLDVQWRTGRVTRSAVLEPSRMPTVSGGHEVRGDFEEPQQVFDAQTGEVLLEVPRSDTMLMLSPDGRYAFARPWQMCDESGDCTFEKPRTRLYDVAAGTHLTIPIDDAALGWTPQGDLLRVDEDSVDVCEPTTGDCYSTPVEVDGRNLRLGGSIYEA